jgi:hypothetical protein
MRFSRLKGQLDGTVAARPPRNPNTPRRSRVEKNKSPKKTKRQDHSDDEDDENIKLEGNGSSSSRSNSVGRVPEGGTGPVVKSEPGLGSRSVSDGTPLPSTPRRLFGEYEEDHENEAPGGSFQGGNVNDIDEMLTSFEEGIFPTMMGDHHSAGGMGHLPYGMNMQIGMGDQFESLWDPATSQVGQGGHHPVMQDSEGNVLVKREPRWEDNFRQG